MLPAGITWGLVTPTSHTPDHRMLCLCASSETCRYSRTVQPVLRCTTLYRGVPGRSTGRSPAAQGRASAARCGRPTPRPPSPPRASAARKTARQSSLPRAARGARCRRGEGGHGTHGCMMSRRCLAWARPGWVVRYPRTAAFAVMLPWLWSVERAMAAGTVAVATICRRRARCVNQGWTHCMRFRQQCAHVQAAAQCGHAPHHVVRGLRLLPAFVCQRCEVGAALDPPLCKLIDDVQAA